ncbi:MAG: glycosyltransferase [Planctomycetales bacterium]|nr:glycosyltransferase [Planctomycetales bacterium]
MPHHAGVSTPLYCPDPNYTSPHPSIVVAVLTCQRNDTLRRFLAEFSKIEFPSNAHVILLVVDNDEDGSALPIVETHRDQIPCLRYVVERTSGIPFARNRAMDEAFSQQADFLCFIDDDEFPDRQWLVSLVEAWRQSQAELIGGPVSVAPADASLGWWQKLINKSLASRQQRKNVAAANAPTNGRRPTIVTNNWWCDLQWLKQTGIRFDERLAVTGGSDTAFFKAAVARGCKTAWCPDAVVYETVTPDRLSLRYQFRRGASQSMTHFHMKHYPIVPSTVVVTAVNAIARFLLGCLLFVMPLYGTASIVMAIRSLGWAVGRIQALLGSRSKLYDRRAVTVGRTSRKPVAADWSAVSSTVL